MVSAIVQSARTIMTTKTKRADATDHSVAEKIRVQRILCGLSQTELGNKLGVTFQQIQKYEKGSNRVSAGRLKQIADILEIPVSFFFEGASGKDASVENINEGLSFLETAASVRLVRAFSEIENQNIRSGIVTLVEGHADQEPKQVTPSHQRTIKETTSAWPITSAPPDAEPQCNEAPNRLGSTLRVSWSSLGQCAGGNMGGLLASCLEPSRTA